VINSKGQIGLQDDEGFNIQRLTLESEGVEFSGERQIDLKLFQYHPELN
jgi:methylated-DNA-protein-cysteine methyltransferase-like protein